MRPRFVLAVLLAAAGLTALLAWVSGYFRLSPGAAIGSPSVSETAGAVMTPPSSTPGAPVPAPQSIHANTSSADASTSRKETHEEMVWRRTAELNDLAMNNDAGSRDAILAELQNPNLAIRKAALEAAIQFGDRSVVPRLQEIANYTEDPAEKAALLAAIDYINLPTMAEHVAEQKARREALGITNTPGGRTNTSRRSPLIRSQQPQAPGGAN